MCAKYGPLFARYARLSFLRMTEYRFQVLVKVIADCFSVLVTLLFWGAIFSMTKTINGWDLGQILLLQGFFNTFIVFYWLFFAGSQRLNHEIFEGTLDRHLSRPINPVIAHMFENIQFFIFDDVFRAVAFFAAAFAAGVQIAFLNFTVAFLFVFLAAMTLAFMFMAVECTAFWFGRVEAAHGLFELLWDVGSYPTTIFPGGLQFVLMIIVPIFFLQTYPTLFTTQVMGWDSILSYLTLSIATLLSWYLIFLKLWRKGLKRYEATGG